MQVNATTSVDRGSVVSVTHVVAWHDGVSPSTTNHYESGISVSANRIPYNDTFQSTQRYSAEAYLLPPTSPYDNHQEIYENTGVDVANNYTNVDNSVVNLFIGVYTEGA